MIRRLPDPLELATLAIGAWIVARIAAHLLGLAL